MPRKARIKYPEAVYHVMAHSISEFDLFPDNSDKEYFLDLLTKYKEKHKCRVYAFCLMSNHYHLIIDMCGFDISKFMKSLNQSHVKFINKKYKRKGHLLTERFQSKVIDSDDYLLTASAYVHSNPKDLIDYNGREFDYPYSSMGIYLNKIEDKRNLVYTDFILDTVNGKARDKAIKAYTEVVIEKRDIGMNKKLKKYLEDYISGQYESRSYRQIILRDKKPDEVIKIVAESLGISDTGVLKHKWKRKSMEFRRITAYVLNNYCGLGINEVTKLMNNISSTCCSYLCNKGYEAFQNNSKLKECF